MLADSKTKQETHSVKEKAEPVNSSYCVKDRLVFGQCYHAQPVAQILQQGAIREVGSCLVRSQENLKEMQKKGVSVFTIQSDSSVL